MSETTTTDMTTTTTTNTTETADKGASFRQGEANDASKDKEETITVQQGRFGVATTKTATKISFRILTNATFAFKPYGGLCKEGEFSIKPGGIEGAIKPFTSSSGRKQFKKVGIRISYTLKALFSVRDKFLSMPSDIKQIPDVLEEGLGDFEAMTAKTKSAFSMTSSSTSDKLSPSKLRKATTSASAKKANTENNNKPLSTPTDNASTYSDSKRYDGNNEMAQFRVKETLTSPSYNQSKLKKTDKITPSPTKSELTEIQKTAVPSDAVVVNESKSLSEKSKRPSATMKTEEEISNNSAEKPKKRSSKPLSASKGGWGRGKQSKDPMAVFTKKITIRLNKITMDNFESLSKQLINIFSKEVRDTTQLTKMVTLIFEKTVQEHLYGPLYADLCVALSEKDQLFDEIFINDFNQKETRQVGFKSVLVKVCQNEFTKGKRAVVYTDDMDARDRANEEIKQKKILLGTMKFIGQLYLKELIPSRIMTVCLRHLVGQNSISKTTEDDVEGACALLQTVGQTLDNDEKIKGELTKYYGKLKSIEKNSKFSLRIRMLVQNLIDLRKNGWKDTIFTAAAPKALKKDNNNNNKMDSNMFELDDEIPFGLDMMNLIMGGADDENEEMIMPSTVPIAAGMVAANTRKWAKSTNRYSASSTMQSNALSAMNAVNAQMNNKANDNNNNNNNNNAAMTTARRSTRRDRMKGRRLLETEDEEIVSVDVDIVQNEDYEERKMDDTEVRIGMRKVRTALSASSKRPCDDGKEFDDETADELLGDYLYNRNGVNTNAFMEKIIKYKLQNRSKFVLKFIQKAVDGGKGEKLSDILPKLLNEYILLSSELDGGFIEFFRGYTFEDNPQIAKGTSALLAPLLVDNELNFNDVTEWILLDTYDNQPDDDMLKFYDGDGVRNYIRGPGNVTKAMELIAMLMKDLKEACFEDSQYVPKLIKEYDFSIDQYINKKDLDKIDEIKAGWIEKYGLQFAF